MQFNWTVTDEAISIKKFLAQRDISHRLFAQLKATTGALMVNGHSADPQIALGVGDEVTVILPPEPSDPNVPISHEPLELIDETANDLVVAKPAGLTVVPGPSNRTDTLVNRVKGRLADENATFMVPHILTRLDRDTSGLVLVAKHRLANSWYSQQATAGTLQKRYLAVVSGILADDHGLIDRPLRRADDGFNQIVSPDGKPAQTEYWVRQRGTAVTLVEVQLHTGRTHQIRAHFAAIGHPLLGDALYGGPLDQIDRQALHAYDLRFRDPLTDSERTYELPLPDDLQHLI